MKVDNDLFYRILSNVIIYTNILQIFIKLSGIYEFEMTHIIYSVLTNLQIYITLLG